MQPLENKRTKNQTGVARARLLLKRDLGWLPGYPLNPTSIDGDVTNALKWHSIGVKHAGNSSFLAIDAEHLRRAQMTISKLRHHFPRALPMVVDDVDDWLLRTDFLMGMLKDFVHRGKTFCANDVLDSGVLPVRWTTEVKRMKSVHSSLTGLLDAVTFLALSDRRTCELESLAWIEKHAAELVLLVGVEQESPWEQMIQLLSVRKNLSSELLKVVIRCLTDPVIRQCRWKCADGWLDQLRGELMKASKQLNFVFPKPPNAETLDQRVRAVFADVCLERPKAQRNTFQLLEQILTVELIGHVADTQRQIALTEISMSKLLRCVEDRHEPLLQTKASRDDLKAKVAMETEISSDRCAVVAALGKCLGELKRLHPTEMRSWVDLLAAFPQGQYALRVRLLAKWWQDWHGWRACQDEFSRVIKELSRLARRRGIAAPILEHWHGYVDGTHSYFEFVENTCHELSGNHRLEVRSVRLLEKVAYDLQLDVGHQLLSSLPEFAQATDDDNLSCSLIEHLAKKPDEEYNAIDLRLAYHFGDSIDAILKLLTALLGNNELTELATQLKPLVDDPILKAIVAKRLAENDVGTLSRVATTTAFLVDIGQPVPEREMVSQPMEWIQNYPGDFQSALIALAQVTREASRIAESVLGKYFPSSASLRLQIRSLESKLAVGGNREMDRPRLQRRLANLRRRKTETVPISQARRDKLIEKLEKRTDLEILEQYASTCRVRAAAATQKQFDLKEIPDEWWQPPFDRVLRQINRLSRPMQELGIRLLFETLERKTRNFDEEPSNVAFRKRMEDSGVLMKPWLSDESRQVAMTADGTSYELAFTRDVIDFLLMGFHFDTCLSPDSFNFFSTVANAVDLNKRVVYGKTVDGKIIGRCLFAINDAGEVLTYRRYSHNPKDGFASAVDRFAEQLVTGMRTSITSSGNVSKLVARDWYDDGPIQTEVDWLGDGGTLANLMKDVADEDLLHELKKVLGRGFLKPRVADLAIDARVRSRIEILTPLLDEFEDEMSNRQKFFVAVNVEPVAVSHRLLSQLRWSDIVGLVTRHKCDVCDVFHGIAECSKVFSVLSGYHPSLGLRAIRASRPSSIKSDILDPNRIRRTALAQVHRKLGRRQLAEKLIAI